MEAGVGLKVPRTGHQKPRVYVVANLVPTAHFGRVALCSSAYVSWFSGENADVYMYRGLEVDGLDVKALLNFA